MGLAISRSIIEAHGGRVWVTANAQHGAVFQFTLPLKGERVSWPNPLEVLASIRLSSGWRWLSIPVFETEGMFS